MNPLRPILARAALGLALGLAALGLARGGSALATEHASYTLLAAHEGFEVRRYDARMEARVETTGPMRQATREGFRPLAAYIFGGNADDTSIAMTAPVATRARPADADAWTVAFVMPATWTADRLPSPDDARVSLHEEPATTWAVRTFSGYATDDAVARETRALREAAAAANVALAAPLEVRQYDPPWVPGPQRTNDVALRVAE